MGLETMAIISAGMQIVSGIVQYSQQAAADKAEKRAYEESLAIAREQNALDRKDAERAAQEELALSEKARKTQKMLFLNSGVDLTGSPLLVMEETRAKGAENAKNIMDSQKSRGNLMIRSAAANKPVSRASLLNTGLDVGKGLTSTYSDYSLMKRQLA